MPLREPYSPVLEATLQSGEVIVSTHGDLGWMTPNIQLSQTTGMGKSGSRGLMKSAKRAIGGGGLFITRYQADGGPGSVTFASKLPGNIISVQVAPDAPYYVHRSGFMCGTEGIEASMGMQQKFSSGIFGGMGFFLQHLEGEGVAWLELSGEIFAYDLQAGETLRVHPGHVGAFEGSVQFKTGTIPGLANKFFGGNGFFFADLTGPGKVWLQSMSISTLAAEISDYLPQQKSSSGSSGAGGVIGGLLGGN